MSAIAIPTLPDTSLRTLDLKSRSRDAALAEIVDRLGPDARDAALLRESLVRRERLATTAIGKGVALPNVRSLGVDASRMLLARSPRGIPWDAPDGDPVRLVCVVLSPAELSDDVHHESLTRAATALRLQRVRARLFECDDVAERLARWREALG